MSETPAASPASPAKRKHYHDIDGARSVLMFLSVALHAGTVYAPARPWITQNTARHDFFDWLIFGFHLFVTPTFFFVGGFFAVLLLKRRAIGDFLQNRLLRTAVPLITIAVTLNMVEHYLRWVDNRAAGESGRGGRAQLAGQRCLCHCVGRRDMAIAPLVSCQPFADVRACGSGPWRDPEILCHARGNSATG